MKLSTKLSSAGNYDIIAVNLLPGQFEILCLQHESCLYVWCLSISRLTIQCLRDAEHWMFPTATVRWTCSLQTAAVHWPASTWWVEPGRQCNVPQMTSQTYNNNSIHSYCHCLTWTDQTQDRTSTRRFDDSMQCVTGLGSKLVFLWRLSVLWSYNHIIHYLLLRFMSCSLHVRPASHQKWTVCNLPSCISGQSSKKKYWSWINDNQYYYCYNEVSP